MARRQRPKGRNVALYTHRLQRAFYRSLRRKLRSLLTRNERGIINRALKIFGGDLAKNEQEISKQDDEFDRLMELLLATQVAAAIQDAYREGGDRIYRLLLLHPLPRAEEFVVTPAALRYLEQRGLMLAKGISDGVKKRLRKTIEEGIRNGDTLYRIKRAMKAELKDYIDWQVERIARTEASDAANAAALDAFKQSGIVDRKMWLAYGGACPVCEALNGSIVGINATFEGGLDRPPAHPNCYSEDTEVLATDGFVRIGDLEIGDEVFSLNPQTYQPEKTVVVNTIARTEKKMLHFYSHDFDLLVTSDHNMFVERRVDHATRGRKYEPGFCRASELHGEWRIFRGAKWIGREPKTIQGIDSELFVAFLGLWLAEGSLQRHLAVTHAINRTRGIIRIAQSRKKNSETYRTIVQIVKRLSKVVWEAESAVYFRNAKLYRYLEQFGKARSKFVPQVVKNLSPRLIRIFLDHYCMGDGHIRKPRPFKEGRFIEERTYFTCSQQLADDLGELILKVGKRPSFHLMRTRGRECRFSNGTYKLNYDVWRVSECNRLYARRQHDRKGIKTKVVPYKGTAVCVELDRNHTLYVRRNGKCCWCGNCDCSIYPVMKGE